MAKVLDHGSLTLVESWGSDERVIEAARMSTGKGFLGWGPKEATCVRCGLGEAEVLAKAVDGGYARAWCEKEPIQIKHDWKRAAGDEKLLRYLWENKHESPFEFAGAVIEVQAPIFVFREWHRHRVQAFNEASARYSPLPDLNYIPTVERLMMAGAKQGGSTGAVLTHKHAEEYREVLAHHYAAGQAMYDYALRAGVPKELARVHLPVGRYSRMRASANLRNWLAFLTLRMAPAAQHEIRVYAEALHGELSKLFPRTLALFDEGFGR